MFEEINIRKATLSDYSLVLPLLESVSIYHSTSAPWKFHTPKTPITKEYFDSLIQDPQNTFLLAIGDEGEIAGYIIAYIRTTPAIPILRERTFMMIDNMGVKENKKRVGIGSLLLENIEKIAKENNIREIELNVWDFNTPALLLYEKQGYTTTTRHMRKVL